MSSLRKDLTALRKDGMVTLHTGPNVTYQSTAIAPIILTVFEDSLVAFCQNYEEHITATSELLPVKQAYHKIYEEMLGPGYEEEVYHVKVLLQDFGNVLSRFRMLKDLLAFLVSDDFAANIPSLSKACHVPIAYVRKFLLCMIKNTVFSACLDGEPEDQKTSLTFFEQYEKIPK